LAKKLDPEIYIIVLVGTDEEIDKQLPDNIISIHRTQDQKELSEIYSAADVFVNPTREEALGLVNIEANACGTPVVTFRTGGSPECISEASGSIVERNDIDCLEKEIIRVCEEKPYSKDACRRQAECFDMNAKYMFRVYLSGLVVLTKFNQSYGAK
jgi:glycosyltransferase involved in cell wall biosynthesis